MRELFVFSKNMHAFLVGKRFSNFIPYTIVHAQFLGFTMQICSKSEWGSTSTVLMFMLYWRANDGKLHVFATKHEANTYMQ